MSDGTREKLLQILSLVQLGSNQKKQVASLYKQDPGAALRYLELTLELVSVPPVKAGRRRGGNISDRHISFKLNQEKFDE